MLEPLVASLLRQHGLERALGRDLAVREGVTEEHSPGLETLHPDEAAMMGKAVDKRRREFVAGRTLARAAMRAIGEPARPIVNGSDRAPIWPAGLTGSITHTRGWAAAVVARAHVLESIGLDVEDGSALKDSLKRQICAPEDEVELERQRESARGVLAKVVFSAKEAAYKAQYARSRHYLGFMAMWIELLPDDPSAPLMGGAFVAHFRQPAGEAFGIGDRLAGRFIASPQHVATAVVLP